MNDVDGFQQGYDAYWDGVDRADNPNVPGTEEEFSWAESWACFASGGPDAYPKQSFLSSPARIFGDRQ